MFFSPLEQFQVLPLIPLFFYGFDISLTNQTVIYLLLFFFTIVSIFCMKDQKSGSFFIIPNRFQSFVELIYSVIYGLVSDNIKSDINMRFFPLVFSIFFFILSLNLIGLIPYSFTITSHLIVTLSFSVSIFLGINIICVRKHGRAFFSLFLPVGTSVGLALLLVPIEIISYVFRPISLGTRLFVNMMAGHTLLKVIAGFSFTLLTATGFTFFLHFVPLLILLPLIGLELAVALIQSFVFSILICIYLNDAINLH